MTARRGKREDVAEVAVRVYEALTDYGKWPDKDGLMWPMVSKRRILAAIERAIGEADDDEPQAPLHPCQCRGAGMGCLRETPTAEQQRVYVESLTKRPARGRRKR